MNPPREANETSPPTSTPPLFSLDGRVAIVTGGTTGIGMSISERMQAAGAHVVATNLPDAVPSTDHRDPAGVAPIQVVAADARSRTEMEAVVQGCIDDHGQLDIMVGCAGVGDSGTVLDTSDGEWEKVMSVNLYGAFLCTQLASRAMKPNGYGRIVLVSSTNAFWVEAGMAAYNVSKAGVAALVRTAAVELGESGITVNAVGPGLIETAMTSALRSRPDAAARYLEGIPTGRFGAVDDVSAAVSFLVSDEAEWTTGQLLVVDGGQTAGMKP